VADLKDLVIVVGFGAPSVEVALEGLVCRFAVCEDGVETSGEVVGYLDGEAES
jgi:hypothetical protein